MAERTTEKDWAERGMEKFAILDKGCRSPNTEEQYEAILQFPAFLAEFPFPAVVDQGNTRFFHNGYSLGV